MGFPHMLVGYMRVSSDSDRQTTDLQRDALLSAGVDARHLFEDRASGAKDDRPGLTRALAMIKKISPAAWRHVHLNGHYTFRSDGQIINLDTIVAELEAG